MVLFARLNYLLALHQYILELREYHKLVYLDKVLYIVHQFYLNYQLFHNQAQLVLIGAL